MRPEIPLIAPEIVRSLADAKYGGDTEKIATTTTKPFSYRRVNLSSRYDKADEYELMLDLVDYLDDFDVGVLETIYCDSKSCTYSINLGFCNFGLAKAVGRKIEAFFIDNNHWHNGLYVNGKAGNQLDYWCALPEDVFEE